MKMGSKLSGSIIGAGTLTLGLVGVWLSFAGPANEPDADGAVRLPQGVKAVWDVSQAYGETTSTRSSICINGLWRWQPADHDSERAPADGWGYFKVPGCWPGVTNYMQKDCQTVYVHPKWKNSNLRNLAAAWYQREITIPREWAGCRITVYAEYLNSFAVVYVDGKRVGEMRYPWGEVDVTSVCVPGGQHVLTMLVVAMPLKGVMLSYNDTASAREVKGSVARRGLCGDVFLVSVPAGPRIADVKVDTSVRRWEITFDAALQGLSAGGSYAVYAGITDNGRVVREFKSPIFKAEELREGRIAFTEKWQPEKLWDTHTPQNMYRLRLSLVDAGGQVLDAFCPVHFGFREFWIDGQDFYLNGTRIFLSAVPLDNAQVGAMAATYEAARESMERLRSFGINFVYTHNYGCQPGTHLSFSEILQAADDLGMLVALSQPHFGHYEWDAPDTDRSNGYARHAEFYMRVAQHHPSVVMYAMSHNATGYNEDMNPHMIDGIQETRNRWSLNNSKLALRAEAIVKRLDSSRIVYHHSSGNLGSMHTSNFYPNFVPVQEMSDWFEHWAIQGAKPVFLCEYGVPFSWDWTMYRGWYKGKREFGSAKVPWEFCLAEWNSQFFGDRAFQISELEKANLRWEAKQFRAGNVWHRWDYPTQVGSSRFDERYPVFALYYTDNWRAFRTWGVSANSPWEHHLLWKQREGIDKGRRELKVDWEKLQRPGFSPDYLEQRYARMDMAFERSDWIPTAGAKALIRNNQPLLAYLGGKPARFTSKEHNFVGGEIIEKQIIVINNSRRKVSCECSWNLALPQSQTGSKNITVETGEQERISLKFAIPATAAPGQYALTTTATFSTGETQEDEFTIHMLPRRPAPQVEARVALFDPKGETGELLKALGIPYETVDANVDLAAYDMLIVGKAALTVDAPAPDIHRVRDGLKTLVFEQTSDALEKRLGFRVQEYGLRNVFKRIPEHPALAGLETENLRDWRGEATILPPRLKYELSPRYNYAPTVTWCGIEVPRLWRCGCRGNVASVLIEKPACGDFLPIVDGGFSLQYTPLLEYREGKGMVFFCQLDVTGRTEGEPAADTLAANILEYVSGWTPSPRRRAVYIGEPAGKSHLEAAGLQVDSYGGGELKTDRVLIVGPGGGKALAANKEAVGAFLKAGGGLLAIGLTQEDADALLPFKVAMSPTEHINAYFEPPGVSSPLVGVGPADVHNRDPRIIPLVSGGARTVGNGVLAVAYDADAVFCQLVPWRFEYRKNFGVKRTFRRCSFVVTRLLANLGVSGETPLLHRFSSPVTGSDKGGRWLQGFYLETPEEMDDPYRFFRW